MCDTSVYIYKYLYLRVARRGVVSYIRGKNSGIFDRCRDRRAGSVNNVFGGQEQTPEMDFYQSTSCGRHSRSSPRARLFAVTRAPYTHGLCVHRSTHSRGGEGVVVRALSRGQGRTQVHAHTHIRSRTDETGRIAEGSDFFFLLVPFSFCFLVRRIRVL